MNITRKQISNTLAKMMNRYPKYQYWFCVVRLLIWAIPHPLHLKFWITKQLPDVLRHLDRSTWSNSRRSQRLIGRAYFSSKDMSDIDVILKAINTAISNCKAENKWTVVA